MLIVLQLQYCLCLDHQGSGYWGYGPNTGSTIAGALLDSPGENVTKVGTILPLPYHPLLGEWINFSSTSSKVGQLYPLWSEAQFLGNKEETFFQNVQMWSQFASTFLSVWVHIALSSNPKKSQLTVSMILLAETQTNCLWFSCSEPESSCPSLQESLNKSWNAKIDGVTTDRWIDGHYTLTKKSWFRM